MGNISTVETNENALEVFQKLMQYGYPDKIAWDAANKYPNIDDIFKAIEYIEIKTKDNTTNDDEKGSVETKQGIEPTVIESNTSEVNVEAKEEEIINDETDKMHKEKISIKNYGKENMDKCDITECLSLSRIIPILKFYHNNHEQCDDDNLSEYFINYGQIVLNDYHHILEHHLNEDKTLKPESNKQYEMMYKQIMNADDELSCDIKKCKIYLRQNRERETKQNYTDLSIYLDVLDSIHCFFIHSADNGYTIIDTLDDEVNDNIAYDKELASINLYLQEKRKYLEQIRGYKRFSNNKFLTQNNINKDDIERKDTQDTQHWFGDALNYWNNKDNSLRAKYSSMKEELINNNIYCIDTATFNAVYKKAMYLLNKSNKIKHMKSCVNVMYGIEDGLPLNVQNILCVILYTDYDTLSYHFRCTFGKMLKAENKEYFNWSKKLCETVNCFGISVNNTNIKTFYHAADYMHICAFSASYNMPTSMTTKLQIAVMFAIDDGMILEVEKFNDFRSGDLKYFNCTFFSSFGYEDERLFIQHSHACFGLNYYLRLKSIRSLKTFENYKEFMNALEKLQAIFEYGDKYLSHGLSSQSIEIINNLLLPNVVLNDSQCPSYIFELFKQWTMQKKNVSINLSDLYKYSEISKHLLYDNNNNIRNLLSFNNINVIFEAMEEITCYNIGIIQESYLKLLLVILESVNTLKHSTLNKIWLCNVKNIGSNLEFERYESQFMEIKWKIQKNAYDPNCLILLRC